MRIRILMTLSLALAACSSAAEKSGAEQQVLIFHERFNGERFVEIYDNTDVGFRDVTSKADYLKFMTAARAKLGKEIKSEQSGWQVNYGTGGTRVNLVYATQFERGNGTESFIFIADGNSPRLFGYNINSTALVIN